MARRDDFDDFFADDDVTPVVDTRADGRLYRVPLARLSPNLVNPRQDFGTEDELIDFGKSLARRQNQPCPVVSRVAYLKLWPDHADRIGDVDYVLVSGERRYRAATTVGLPALDCVANDDFASDRKTFMEAVVSENVDRQNFDPIEEAYAVQSLVREFGSNRAVAQHFERVDGWVTQRLLLTNLASEVQNLVRDKAMPLEAARKLGKLARDNGWDAKQQTVWWEEEQDRRAAASAARSAARKASRDAVPPAEPTVVPQTATSPPPAVQAPEPVRLAAEPSFTAVKQVPTPAPAADRAPALPSAPSTAHEEPKPLPGARQAPDAAATARAEQIAEGRRMPYENGFQVSQHLIRKMPREQLVLAIRELVQYAVEEGLDVMPQSTP
ncbi:ParB/RepB/Spo0J family partition protein [Streptomyces viridodiastaticus]|uniref:ParB/RepB/Spo0J family partition protein n=1 Tax=Streptomyces albogriseolus TaxID=1887 RepID=UPI0022524AF6|nr:ParB/RepB/Spo0J family partition protein [Streptomyces viridodiastaticus]MCX4571568.1 ParB/RepB/Spo0J family partition protein [Streptomyces viridodiastaticus]